MAFYRCGGGGIPSSLKTDMNAVLNKKFGTSSDYPPADWAPTVNLMGPLPEKTIVSSPIADFSDGADDVPTKSLVVTIPPTLTGVSSVSETQTGKNICSVAPWVRDTTFYGSNWTGMVAFLNTLPVGNYSVSYDYEITALIGSSIDVAYSPYIRALVNGSYVNVTAYSAPQTDSSPTVGKIYHCSASFSITSQTVGNIANFYLYCGQSGIKVAEVTVKNAMVELGSTVSTYEPYTPTQYTANLGRTIYGGTADIVNGEGQDGYAKDSMSSTYLSGLSSSYIGYEASTNYFGGHPTIWVRNWNYQTAKIRQAGGIGCVCNEFPVSMHNTDIINTQNRIYFDVNGKGISDVSGFIAFVQNLEANNESLDIVYELETATDFTFDGQEIPTRLGYNAFWSDEGDTEVTYRADINLALGGQ